MYDFFVGFVIFPQRIKYKMAIFSSFNFFAYFILKGIVFVISSHPSFKGSACTIHNLYLHNIQDNVFLWLEKCLILRISSLFQNQEIHNCHFLVKPQMKIINFQQQQL